MGPRVGGKAGDGVQPGYHCRHKPCQNQLHQSSEQLESEQPSSSQGQPETPSHTERSDPSRPRTRAGEWIFSLTDHTFPPSLSSHRFTCGFIRQLSKTNVREWTQRAGTMEILSLLFTSDPRSALELFSGMPLKTSDKGSLGKLWDTEASSFWSDFLKAPEPQEDFAPPSHHQEQSSPL